MTGMNGISLLEQALQIESPWYVEGAEVDHGARVVSVQLDFERGGGFVCGSCGLEGCKGYDTRWKRWRHIDCFAYRTLVHAPSPRVKCPVCGVRQARLPWARRGSGFTRGLEEHVAEMAEDLPLTLIGRLLGEHDTRLGYMLRNRRS